MPTTKSHFFLKLIPSRPTFAMDLSAEERAIMEQHTAYWRTAMANGDVVVFGPVMDPAGPYGIGVFAAEDAAAVEAFTAGDPAATILRYEFHPMRAVLPS